MLLEELRTEDRGWNDGPERSAMVNRVRLKLRVRPKIVCTSFCLPRCLLEILLHRNKNRPRIARQYKNASKRNSQSNQITLYH